MISSNNVHIALFCCNLTKSLFLIVSAKCMAQVECNHETIEFGNYRTQYESHSWNDVSLPIVRSSKYTTKRHATAGNNVLVYAARSCQTCVRRKSVLSRSTCSLEVYHNSSHSNISCFTSVKRLLKVNNLIVLLVIWYTNMSSMTWVHWRLST